MKLSFDYVIIGAGIVGLTIAYQLKNQQPKATILILEKEPSVGVHASGRNSGVLHTGIYYPAGTLKARLCKAGADAMFEFAIDHNIPVRKDGKVIVATSEENARGLDKLMLNASRNGINAIKVSGHEIRDIEPHACADFGGIYCKDTAVINSPRVLEAILQRLLDKGVEIRYSQAVSYIDDEKKTVKTQASLFNYGYLVNAAGAYADKVAKLAGLAQNYELVPFKGLYYKLAPEAADRVRGSIYPVPDPALPFLGIHFTRVIQNDVYIGPTAIPAIGRENYGLIEGAKPIEACSIGFQLLSLYLKNPQNFRNLVHREVPHYFKSRFLDAARKLVDRLEPSWVQASPKVGIRPQLVNTQTRTLEMDFLLEHGSNSIHILNSISPAFTSSFAFAALVVDQVQAK